MKLMNGADSSKRSVSPEKPTARPAVTVPPPPPRPQLMCSCGRPAEVDIHCQHCFFEGAYSGHMSLIMGPDLDTHRVGMRWPTKQQILEAERRAEADLAGMVVAEETYARRK